MPRPPKTHTNGYPTAADLLAVRDLQEEEVKAWGYTLKVRALTLPEREQVLLAALKDDGTFDEEKLVAGYLRFGMVAPALDDDEAAQLAKKHAETVTLVTRLIQYKTNLPYGTVQAVAKSLIPDGDAPTRGADEPSTA